MQSVLSRSKTQRVKHPHCLGANKVHTEWTIHQDSGAQSPEPLSSCDYLGAEPQVHFQLLLCLICYGTSARSKGTFLFIRWSLFKMQWFVFIFQEILRASSASHYSFLSFFTLRVRFDLKQICSPQWDRLILGKLWTLHQGERWRPQDQDRVDLVARQPHR